MLTALRKGGLLVLARLTPATRCFRLRAWLFRRAGYSVHSSARICSSVRFLGTFQLRIGERTFVGHESMITGGDCQITIGRDCDISTRVLFISGTHELTPFDQKVAGPGHSEDISIGDGCWIGAQATILGGVTIGERSMVAAGATVTRSVPPGTMVGGVPAKVIRDFKSDPRWRDHRGA